MKKVKHLWSWWTPEGRQMVFDMVTMTHSTSHKNRTRCSFCNTINWVASQRPFESPRLCQVEKPQRFLRKNWATDGVVGLKYDVFGVALMDESFEDVWCKRLLRFKHVKTLCQEVHKWMLSGSSGVNGGAFAWEKPLLGPQKSPAKQTQQSPSNPMKAHHTQENPTHPSWTLPRLRRDEIWTPRLCHLTFDSCALCVTDRGRNSLPRQEGVLVQPPQSPKVHHMFLRIFLAYLGWNHSTYIIYMYVFLYMYFFFNGIVWKLICYTFGGLAILVCGLNLLFLLLKQVLDVVLLVLHLLCCLVLCAT